MRRPAAWITRQDSTARFGAGLLLGLFLQLLVGRDLNLDATVLRPPIFRRVARHRRRLAVATCGQPSPIGRAQTSHASLPTRGPKRSAHRAALTPVWQAHRPVTSDT